MYYFVFGTLLLLLSYSAKLENSCPKYCPFPKFTKESPQRGQVDNSVPYLTNHQSPPSFHYVVSPHKVSVTGNREPGTMGRPTWEGKIHFHIDFTGILVHIYREPHLIIKGILPQITIYL